MKRKRKVVLVEFLMHTSGTCSGVFWTMRAGAKALIDRRLYREWKAQGLVKRIKAK